jgi:hypothetical protein
MRTVIAPLGAATLGSSTRGDVPLICPLVRSALSHEQSFTLFPNGAVSYTPGASFCG